MVYRPFSDQRMEWGRRLFLPLLLVLLGLLFMVGYVRPFSTNPYVLSSGNPFPLSFVPNAGQTDAAVRFMAQNRGMNLFFMDDGLTFAGESANIAWQYVGANTAEIVGGDALPGVVNYLYGSDADNWRTGLPTFGTVAYEGIYPGLDAVFDGSSGQLEATFELAAGIDPAVLEWQFEGANPVFDEQSGGLRLVDGKGRDVMILERPMATQQMGADVGQVQADYSLRADGTIGLALSENDPALGVAVTVPAVFLGERADDWAQGVATNAEDNIYVVGRTGSIVFPLSNPLQPEFGGDINDVFLTKFSADGSELLFSTYLGGSGGENGSDIVVDADGNAYITGITESPDFPLVNPIQSQLNDWDVFISKISADGTQLLFSTLLGGTDTDHVNEIMLDDQNNILIVGDTYSADFPSIQAFQTMAGGGSEIFISKISGATYQLVFSTFLGGAGEDFAGGIDLDQNNNIFVTGGSYSTDFPVINSTLPQPPNNPGRDNVVAAKIMADGSGLVYSTLIGGDDYENGRGITVDNGGNAYIVGSTRSDDFPLVQPIQNAVLGQTDVFALKIDPTADSLIFSTFLGGSVNDYGLTSVLDGSGDLVFSGVTSSENFPLVNPLAGTGFGGDTDGFITRLSPDGQLGFSTYLGGEDFDEISAVVVDSSGRVIVAGLTYSADFPTVNAFQSELDDAPDGFVSRINTTETALEYSTYLGGGYPEPTGVSVREFGGTAEMPSNILFLGLGLLFLIVGGLVVARQRNMMAG